MATKTRGGSKYKIYLNELIKKGKRFTFTKPLLLGRDFKKNITNQWKRFYVSQINLINLKTNFWVGDFGVK